MKRRRRFVPSRLTCVLFFALAWVWAGTLLAGRVAQKSSVPPPPLVSIAISPSAVSILPGSTQQLTATGTYSDNSTQNLTSSVSWTSSSTIVASISNLGLATAISTGITTVTASLTGVQATATLTVSFAPVANTMTSGRELHTATLLTTGKVLIAGGSNSSVTLATAELYDPVSGRFTPTTGTMTGPRAGHTATLLTTGKVLIAGGSNGSGPIATAELYDPASDRFTPTTGNMIGPRLQHTATLLSNGKVLITGGTTDVPQKTAEIYDPVAGTFTATTSTMTYARWGHIATSLLSGNVLIAGGTGPAVAELYDPVSGGFTPTGSMTGYRDWPTATRLNSGAVLMAGGLIASGVANAETYDPTTGSFTPTTGSMSTNRYYHTATLLNNGQVLITGGTAHNAVATAELYNPLSGMWTSTGSMASARWRHTATLLNNGSVLITGGATNAVGSLSTAELYLPPTLPSITLSPTNLAFGNQFLKTSSAAKVITLTNPGPEALTIAAIVPSGANSTEFNQTNSCGTTVAPGGTCTISVTFQPVTAGAKTAAITINDDSAGSPHSVSLTGTGVAPVSVNPPTLNFPAQTVGTTSGARVITVKNNLPTKLTGISIVNSNPTEFPVSATTCGTTLNAGATCRIRIKFRPTSTGARSGTLSINDSASTSPQTVNLTGTGK